MIIQTDNKIPHETIYAHIGNNDFEIVLSELSQAAKTFLGGLVKSQTWDHAELYDGYTASDYGFDPLYKDVFTSPQPDDSPSGHEHLYYLLTGRSIHALADDIACDDCEQSYNSHGVSVFKNNHVGWDSVLCNECIQRNYENPSYKNWSK